MAPRRAADARGVAEHLYRSAMFGKNVLRQVHTVEAAIVLRAILKVVDHLQRGAQRVGGRPNRLVLIVDVKNEPADRHRREAAVIHQFRPICVATFPRIKTKGVKEIEGVPRAESPFAQSEPQRFGLRIFRTPAAQRVAKTVKHRELLVHRKH